MNFPPIHGAMLLIRQAIVLEKSQAILPFQFHIYHSRAERMTLISAREWKMWN
jgi:hypothetical protein